MSLSCDLKELGCKGRRTAGPSLGAQKARYKPETVHDVNSNAVRMRFVDMTNVRHSHSRRVQGGLEGCHSRNSVQGD